MLVCIIIINIYIEVLITILTTRFSAISQSAFHSKKLPRNQFISYEAAARTDESNLGEHGFETSDSDIQV